MDKPNFTLAYSPCPNDTFLFYHLTQTKMTDDFQIKEALMDVEELNQAAQMGKYDITKLSFAAYFSVMDKYELLDSGSALGRNCGPLLIYPRSKNIESIRDARSILSPGENTTARLLLDLYLDSPEIKNIAKDKRPIEQPEIRSLRYDKIIPALEKGEGDLGLIIHEERFTYKDRNMEFFLDLGEWWEKATGHPIPLGCIAVKRELGSEWKKKIEDSTRESLELAWKNPTRPKEYILNHSQNKDLSVVESHINLYVNDFTRSLGDEGNQAIDELLSRKKKAQNT